MEGHWVMTGGQRYGTMYVSWDYEDWVGFWMSYGFRKTAWIMNIA